jgi:CDP-paratose 2-epimerase
VRDVLHVDDLLELVEEQLVRPVHWVAGTFNVGGGREGSLSLVEATALRGELTGNDVAVTRSLKAGLVLCRCTCPIARRYAHTNWRPRARPACRHG